MAELTASAAVGNGGSRLGQAGLAGQLAFVSVCLAVSTTDGVVLHGAHARASVLSTTALSLVSHLDWLLNAVNTMTSYKRGVSRRNR